MAVAISKLEHFNYAVYVSEQLSSFVRYLIGDRGISQLHFVDKTVAHEETKILLYLGVAHIGAVHDLRLARTILSHPEHVRYYLDVRSSPVHFSTPFSGTFGLLLLYYPADTCQDSRMLDSA
jgi:hypothetical protein